VSDKTTLEQRCAIRAFKHAAQALACVALGDARGAAAHSAAGTAYAGLAIAAKGARAAGLPDWMLELVDLTDEDRHLFDAPREPAGSVTFFRTRTSTP
jgi:hypothetical protein